MNVPGFVVFLLGLGLVVVALWILYFDTALGETLPFAAWVAVTLILVGVGVLAAADRFIRTDAAVVRRWH